MTTSSFTKRTGFPDSYQFIQIGDKAQLVCDSSYPPVVKKGTLVQGEVRFICPERTYIVVQAPSLDLKNFLIFYTIYPKFRAEYKWKLKLKDTFLGSQLRNRAAKERKEKFQLNLLPD